MSKELPASHSHEMPEKGSLLWHFHNAEHRVPQHCHGGPTNPYTVQETGDTHVIDREYARGHGFRRQPVWFHFTKKLRKGLWDMHSGVQIPTAEVPVQFKKQADPPAVPDPVGLDLQRFTQQAQPKMQPVQVSTFKPIPSPLLQAQGRAGMGKVLAGLSKSPAKIAGVLVPLTEKEAVNWTALRVGLQAFGNKAAVGMPGKMLQGAAAAAPMGPVAAASAAAAPLVGSLTEGAAAMLGRKAARAGLRGVVPVNALSPTQGLLQRIGGTVSAAAPRLGSLSEIALKAASVEADYSDWNADALRVLKLAAVGDTPYSFHPVFVHPPKKHREKFPFTGYIDFQGIEIDIENKKGSYRKGKDKDGHAWKTLMHAHYGEIRGTKGVDKDALDVYVGPNHDSSLVVVIHQHDPTTGKYDEDKVLLGFDTFEDALKLYKQQYDRSGFYKDGDHKVMPIGQFWRWVHDRANAGKKVAGRVFDYLENLAGEPVRRAERANLRARKDYESTRRELRRWGTSAERAINPPILRDVAPLKRQVLRTRLGTGAAVLGVVGLGTGGILAMDRHLQKKHDAYQAQFKLPDVRGMADPRDKKAKKKPTKLASLSSALSTQVREGLRLFFKRHGLPESTPYVVCAGAALYFHGLRSNIRDIDLLVPALPVPHDTGTYAGLEFDARPVWGIQPGMEAEVLRRSQVIDGICVMDLPSILAMKQAMDRSKDQADIEAVRRHLRHATKATKLAELDTGVDMEQPKRRWPVGALAGGASLGALGAGLGTGKAMFTNLVARHLPEALEGVQGLGVQIDPLVELALRNRFKPQSVGRHALLYGLGGLALGGVGGLLYDMARKEEELPKLGGMPEVGPSERPEVPGLKQPRLATPRLNPEQGKHIPTNPFRGNWKKLGTGEGVLHALGRHAGEAWNAVPTKAKHGVLGAGTLAAAGYTLKETAGQAVNPRPEGVGVGAGARTVQKVLSGGFSRAGSRPGYPGQ